MNVYDQEEQEIINAFEAGKLKSQRPSHKVIERCRSQTRNKMVHRWR
jgi:hypothetical protein